jgi:hypothetical protein
MIAVGAAALAYFLSTIAMPLLVIPLPFFVVFGVLAVPRKGQPMETYIGAMIHFYFQPTKRLWDPDGQDSLVEITNPPIDSTPQVKDIGGAEAAQRLSFLADIEDSQGWSIRTGNANLNDDFAAAATDVTDVFDDTSLNQALSDRLVQSEQQVRDEAIARMSADIATPAAPPTPEASQSSFAPPTYTPQPQAAPAIVTPPPAPNPAITPSMPTSPATPIAAATPAPVTTPEDEAAISAMLRQSSASPTNAFQQTVIQPPNSSPVLGNPTLTTTAMPVAPAPVPVPTAPESVPVPTPPPAPDPTPVPAPTPPPPPPEPIAPTTTAPESATIVNESLGEAVISHSTGSDNSNQGGEISLH